MKFSPLPADFCLQLDGQNLTIEDVVRAARHTGGRYLLNAAVREKMNESRRWVDQVQRSGTPAVYGVNTGFGSKANVPISKEKLRELQRNLVMSHAAGTGRPLEPDVVRAAMLLRANTLAGGHSGIRPEVVELLLQMLSRNVVPWVPAQGSLGASGDLAPLSHLALVLTNGFGEDDPTLSGRAYCWDGTAWELMSGKQAMERAGLARMALEAKEGLALNNGTQISTALLTLAWHDARQLLYQADIAMAMSLEAICGISHAFREEIHALRPHPGQVAVAENIRRLTSNSGLLDRFPDAVQDAYSLRCHPQVLAGVHDTLGYIRNVLQIEMNATTDNPIIFPQSSEENKALSGGNFHAQPVAFAADFLSIVMCEVGNISERRIFRLSDKNLNRGLPSFLISNPGLESGLMIAQYTAASLVSENKSLAHPASIDSIPSCENQEDHVSMAPIAARKARAILENVEKVIAIELLYAAQAIDLRLALLKETDAILGEGTRAAYQRLRQEVQFMDHDRPVYQDIEKAVELVRSGELISAVEAAAGKLN